MLRKCVVFPSSCLTYVSLESFRLLRRHLNDNHLLHGDSAALDFWRLRRVLKRFREDLVDDVEEVNLLAALSLDLEQRLI